MKIWGFFIACPLLKRQRASAETLVADENILNKFDPNMCLI